MKKMTLSHKISHLSTNQDGSSPCKSSRCSCAAWVLSSAVSTSTISYGSRASTKRSWTSQSTSLQSCAWSSTQPTLWSCQLMTSAAWTGFSRATLRPISIRQLACASATFCRCSSSSWHASGPFRRRRLRSTLALLRLNLNFLMRKIQSILWVLRVVYRL